MSGRLSGKVAIITGGARGQGAAHARAMVREGAKVALTDLRVELGEALAAELGGEAVRWEDWEGHAIDADIMISSTSAPHYVLTSAKLEALLKRRARRPLFLIDLAVPRDFEPSINLLDDVYLYDIDDLQSIARVHLRERQTEIGRSIEILKPHVERYMTWAERQMRGGEQRRATFSKGQYLLIGWNRQHLPVSPDSR